MTATGGGGCGLLGRSCALVGGFSVDFLSAGVLCFRRSILLSQISLAQLAHF
jgi:hypothetical protein